MMNSKLFAILTFTALIVSCGSDEVEYYPKPMGYLRLDFPERNFTTYESDCPYTFEVPDYFTLTSKDTSCNRDINISRFNAQIFLTYIPVDTNLNMNVEYSRKLVYDHSIKADEILEAVVKQPENKVYGTKYNIIGDAASPYQFYVTDSMNHFLRGALYFNVKPNYDSIKPSLDYILEDVDHMIETVRWKNPNITDS